MKWINTLDLFSEKNLGTSEKKFHSFKVYELVLLLY